MSRSTSNRDVRVGEIKIRGIVSPKVFVRGAQQKVGGRLDINRLAKGDEILVENLQIMPVHSVVTPVELGGQPTIKVVASLNTHAIFRIGIDDILYSPRDKHTIEVDKSSRHKHFGAVIAQAIV